MDITIDEKLGYIIDIFDSLYIYENRNLLEKTMKDVDISLNIPKELNQCINFIEKNKSLDKDKLSFFFHEFNGIEEGFDLANVFCSIKDLDNKDFEEAIEIIKARSSEEIIRRAAKLLHMNETNEYIDNEQEEILKGKDSIYKFVNNLEFKEEEKWRLYVFLREPEKYREEFVDFLRDYKPEFDKIYEKIAKEREKFILGIKDSVKKSGEEFLTKYSYFINFKGVERVIIFPMMYNCYSINFGFYDENTVYLGLGYRFDKDIIPIKNNKDNEEFILSIMKNLSDSSRYKILKILSKEEGYGMDLARKLNLTTATISHHMSNLHLSNMVTIEKQENKVFYKLNKAVIKAALQQISKDLGLD